MAFITTFEPKGFCSAAEYGQSAKWRHSWGYYSLKYGHIRDCTFENLTVIIVRWSKTRYDFTFLLFIFSYWIESIRLQWCWIVLSTNSAGCLVNAESSIIIYSWVDDSLDDGNKTTERVVTRILLKWKWPILLLLFIVFIILKEIILALYSTQLYIFQVSNRVHLNKFLSIL